jgi:hypothetical protein
MHTHAHTTLCGAHTRIFFLKEENEKCALFAFNGEITTNCLVIVVFLHVFFTRHNKQKLLRDCVHTHVTFKAHACVQCVNQQQKVASHTHTHTHTHILRIHIHIRIHTHVTFKRMRARKCVNQQQKVVSHTNTHTHTLTYYAYAYAYTRGYCFCSSQPTTKNMQEYVQIECGIKILCSYCVAFYGDTHSGTHYIFVIEASKKKEAEKNKKRNTRVQQRIMGFACMHANCSLAR